MINKILILIVFLMSIIPSSYEYRVEKHRLWQGRLPLTIHILKLDRSEYHPRIFFVEDPFTERLSDIVKKEGSQAGINGGFFGRENNEVLGILSMDGNIISNKKIMGRGSIIIDHDDIEIKKINEKEFMEFYKEKLFIMSGSAMILKNRKITVSKSSRKPMTGFGYDEDHFYCIVVEGRHISSFGIDEHGLAEIFKELGCINAIALDGGGSSTMVLNENGSIKMMNDPADGSERRIKTAILFEKNELVIYYTESMREITGIYGYLKDHRPLFKKGKDPAIEYMGKRYEILMPSKGFIEETVYIENKYGILSKELKRFEFKNIRIVAEKYNSGSVLSATDGFNEYSLIQKEDGYYRINVQFNENSKDLYGFLIYGIIFDIINNKENKCLN